MNIFIIIVLSPESHKAIQTARFKEEMAFTASCLYLYEINCYSSWTNGHSMLV